MTTDEMRIAVAEYCGWKWYRLPSVPSDGRKYRCLFLPSILEIEGKPPEGYELADMTESICNLKYMLHEGMVSDYPNDLNAIHSVEDQAGLSVIKAMRFYLYEICDQMTAHHATAAQRCEAFLKAVGKWKETT